MSAIEGNNAAQNKSFETKLEGEVICDVMSITPSACIVSTESSIRLLKAVQRLNVIT